MPNLGRDVGPFLTGFRGEIIKGRYDVFGHVHGKRSLSVDAAMGTSWREFLWENLIGGVYPMPCRSYFKQQAGAPRAADQNAWLIPNRVFVMMDHRMAEETKREDELYRLSMAAPFPPAPLMHRVSGLTSEDDFAQHGRDFYLALSKVSPKALLDFQSILEFGIGSGRLARMFKDYRGTYCGADIDHELLAWTSSALPWVTAMATRPREPLPCASAQFDCVFAISVYSHMDEPDANFYLHEMHRVTNPGGFLFLTVHGQRALDRALSESRILTMLAIPEESVLLSATKLASTGFSFVPQKSHLTSGSYDYGMTFVSADYVRSKWSELFSVEEIVVGGIHDFQDIVVLRRQ